MNCTFVLVRDAGALVAENVKYTPPVTGTWHTSLYSYRLLQVPFQLQSTIILILMLHSNTVGDYAWIAQFYRCNCSISIEYNSAGPLSHSLKKSGFFFFKHWAHVLCSACKCTWSQGGGSGLLLQLHWLSGLWAPQQSGGSGGGRGCWADTLLSSTGRQGWGGWHRALEPGSEKHNTLLDWNCCSTESMWGDVELRNVISVV